MTDVLVAAGLDPEQRLRGVISFRGLFASPDDALVQEVMETEIITVPAAFTFATTRERILPPPTQKSAPIAATDEH